MNNGILKLYTAFALLLLALLCMVLYLHGNEATPVTGAPTPSPVPSPTPSGDYYIDSATTYMEAASDVSVVVYRSDSLDKLFTVSLDNDVVTSEGRMVLDDCDILTCDVRVSIVAEHTRTYTDAFGAAIVGSGYGYTTLDAVFYDNNGVYTDVSSGDFEMVADTTHEFIYRFKRSFPTEEADLVIEFANLSYTQWAWWPSAWQAYNAFNVTNANAFNLTDYQLEIRMYLNASKTDGTDMRVLWKNQSDDTYESVSFWRKEFTNADSWNDTNASGDVFIKAPILYPGITEFLVFYNASGVADLNSAQDVFLLFDDFDSVLNTTRWNYNGYGYSIGSSIIRLDGGEARATELLSSLSFGENTSVRYNFSTVFEPNCTNRIFLQNDSGSVSLIEACPGYNVSGMGGTFQAQKDRELSVVFSDTYDNYGQTYVQYAAFENESDVFLLENGTIDGCANRTYAHNKSVYKEGFGAISSTYRNDSGGTVSCWTAISLNDTTQFPLVTSAPAVLNAGNLTAWLFVSDTDLTDKYQLVVGDVGTQCIPDAFVTVAAGWNYMNQNMTSNDTTCLGEATLKRIGIRAESVDSTANGSLVVIDDIRLVNNSASITGNYSTRTGLWEVQNISGNSVLVQMNGFDRRLRVNHTSPSVVEWSYYLINTSNAGYDGFMMGNETTYARAAHGRSAASGAIPLIWNNTYMGHGSACYADNWCTQKLVYNGTDLRYYQKNASMLDYVLKLTETFPPDDTYFYYWGSSNQPVFSNHSSGFFDNITFYNATYGQGNASGYSDLGFVAANATTYGLYELDWTASNATLRRETADVVSIENASLVPESSMRIGIGTDGQHTTDCLTLYKVAYLDYVYAMKSTAEEPTYTYDPTELLQTTFTSWGYNDTSPGSVVNFTLNVTMKSELDGYIFSFDNGTGTYVNDSFVDVSTPTNPFNFSTTRVINITAGVTIRFTLYLNTTDGTNITSPEGSFVVGNVLNVGTWTYNNTVAGRDIQFNITYNASNGLGGHVIWFDNGTGTLVNSSYEHAAGNPIEVNVSETYFINITNGSLMRIKLTAYDLHNNSLNSSVTSFYSAYLNFTFGTGVHRVLYQPVNIYQKNVLAVNTSSAAPLFNLSITGDYNNYIKGRMNTSITGFSVKCNDVFDSSTATTLTTTATRLNLESNAYGNVSNIVYWCWADFNKPSANADFNITLGD